MAKSVSAGPGKAVCAGPGHRRGLWQCFGIEDGLPSASILCLLEDSRGRLWLGTYRAGSPVTTAARSPPSPRRTAWPCTR